MPAISIRPSKDNLKYLEQFSNRSMFINELLNLARDGKLSLEIENGAQTTKIKTAIKSDKEELAKQKTIAQINAANQRIAESKARTELINIEIDYRRQFNGRPLLNTSKTMIKEGIAANNPIAVNQIISCHKCNEKFPYSNDFTLQNQKAAFADHYFQMHGDVMERDIVDKLHNLRCTQNL